MKSICCSCNKPVPGCKRKPKYKYMQTPFGHLTYCSNIHSGESWKDHFAQLQQHLPLIKKSISPQQAFGVGLRLSNEASMELSTAENLLSFKDWLTQNEAYVFTINGFPYGGFHHTVVKDQVHTPDWQTGERVDYTIRLAHILAQLLPQAVEGGISTSPLSYRYWFSNEEERTEATKKATLNILRVVAALIEIKKSTGKRIHLDIEPEPDGLLESGAEFREWFIQTLLPAGILFLKEHAGFNAEQATEAIRAHVQLCYDVCHFAIGFEAHAQYLQQLKKEGIQVGKIQISAALKAILPTSDMEQQKVFEAFSAFNEPVYLHQVVAKREDGKLERFRDLPQALESKTAREANEWRAHFHVPIFAPAYGALQSTQQDIVDVLKLQCTQPFTQHLEVETYTWEVLQHDLKIPLTESIVRELQWVQGELAKEKIRNE